MSTASVLSVDSHGVHSADWSMRTEGDVEIATTFIGRFTSDRNPYLFPVIGLLDGDSFDASGTSHPSEDVSSSSLQKAWRNDEWILIHVKPRQEKKLAEEMKAHGVPHFLPVTYSKSISRGRSRFSWTPLFPGYLFLKANDDQRLLALKTNRIVATHQVENQDSLSLQLRDLADLIERGVPLRIEERFVAGQNVRVKAGLLKDKRGTIIKRGGKTRLFIMIAELLGGVSVEVEQHLLEPY